MVVASIPKLYIGNGRLPRTGLHGIVEGGWKPGSSVDPLPRIGLHGAGCTASLEGLWKEVPYIIDLAKANGTW